MPIFDGMSANHNDNFSQTTSRKQQHVELAVGERVNFRAVTNGLERYRFTHNALPELDLGEITTATDFLGHTLAAPILISSMTGGYADAERINRALAEAAEVYGFGIGIGSARQAMEDATFRHSYSVMRSVAPNAFIFSNIGAVEVAKLARSGEIKKLCTIIDLVKANALAIHLNPLQELMQPEGSKDFRGVLTGIELAVKELGLPIIVKEVGAGISCGVAQRLIEAGVQAIDVAGAGGTSWSGVEILRHEKEDQDWLEPFWDWGIPTAECICEIAPLTRVHGCSLIASGGVTNGLEVAKSLALGADLAGIARPMITAFMEHSESGLRTFIDHILFQLRGVMLLTGSVDIAALKAQHLVHSG
jgi:isopentenyl-diphosphate delta-isomerase